MARVLSSINSPDPRHASMPMPLWQYANVLFHFGREFMDRTQTQDKGGPAGQRAPIRPVNFESLPREGTTKVCRYDTLHRLAERSAESHVPTLSRLYIRATSLTFSTPSKIAANGQRFRKQKGRRQR